MLTPRLPLQVFKEEAPGVRWNPTTWPDQTRYQKIWRVGPAQFSHSRCESNLIESDRLQQLFPISGPARAQRCKGAVLIPDMDRLNPFAAQLTLSKSLSVPQDATGLQGLQPCREVTKHPARSDSHPAAPGQKSGFEDVRSPSVLGSPKQILNRLAIRNLDGGLDSSNMFQWSHHSSVAWPQQSLPRWAPPEAPEGGHPGPQRGWRRSKNQRGQVEMMCGFGMMWMVIMVQSAPPMISATSNSPCSYCETLYPHCY